MEGQTLRGLLTEVKTGDGRPLFRSGLELAAAIARIEPKAHELVRAKLWGPEVVVNRYLGRPRAAASYINMVLSGLRPCSERMHFLIAEAIKERLVDRPDEQREFVAQFTDLVRRSVLQARGLPEGGITAGTERLLRQEELSSLVVIIQPMAPTLHEFLVDPVRRRLLHRMQLEQGTAARAGHVQEPHGVQRVRRASSYTLCFSDVEAAREEWRRIYGRLRKTLSIADNAVVSAYTASRARSALRKLSEAQRLRIVATRSAITQLPLVAFNPHLKDEASAFVSTAGRTFTDAVALAPELVEHWRSTFYNPILAGGENCVEVEWSEVASALPTSR